MVTKFTNLNRVKKVLFEDNTEWDNMRMLVDSKVEKSTLRTMKQMEKGEFMEKVLAGAPKKMQARPRRPHTSMHPALCPPRSRWCTLF